MWFSWECLWRGDVGVVILCTIDSVKLSSVCENGGNQLPKEEGSNSIRCRNQVRFFLAIF
jgi:hypothetical protein